MNTKEKVIELIKEHSENNIDISENYEIWYDFLKDNSILKTYKEVYKMDLAYLQCEKDKNFIKNGEWDVDGLIEYDQDITYINDNLWLDHHQEYIEDLIGRDRIKQFYLDNNIPIPLTEEEKKQQRLNWAMTQAYIDLKSSTNGFSRFDALLFIFGHDFGEQEIFFASDMEKVRKELLKCIKDVLELINDAIYDGSVKLWLPNHDMWSDEEDEHYCELIRFGGYSVLEDGQKILDADAIILQDDEGNQTLDYFTYQNMNHLCDYIAELFEYYKEDYNNVCDKAYEQEVNKELNDIIDNYWQNTIEFDYAEMEMIL